MVSLSLRQVVALTVAVVAIGGVGFTVLSGPASASAVEQVPDGVDTVVHVDMAITNDTVSRELASAGLNSTTRRVGVSGPANLSAAGSKLDNQTDLDLRAVSDVVLFGRLNRSVSPDGGVEDAEYVGVIVHADWEIDEFFESVRNDTDGVAPTEYERTSYNGQPVLAPVGESAAAGGWVGVLDDGKFVLGSEAAVKDSVDVAVGDAGSFDGELRSAYGETPSGLVTFAFAVPQRSIPGEGEMDVEIEDYQPVETVAGSYYTTRTGAGVELRMVASGTEDARDAADITAGELARAAGTAENETVQEVLRAVEVERNGDTVTVSYEESVDGVEVLLRYLYRDEFA